MTPHFIYALTNCGILKWKKRLVVEDLSINVEKYVCIYKRYKIKVIVDEICYPLTYNIEVLLDNNLVKRYNSFYLKNDIYCKKLYELLNSKNITDRYIVPYSIEYIYDDNRKRSIKIRVLRKEIEIID